MCAFVASFCAGVFSFFLSYLKHIKLSSLIRLPNREHVDQVGLRSVHFKHPALDLNVRREQIYSEEIKGMIAFFVKMSALQKPDGNFEKAVNASTLNTKLCTFTKLPGTGNKNVNFPLLQRDKFAVSCLGVSSIFGCWRGVRAAFVHVCSCKRMHMQARASNGKGFKSSVLCWFPGWLC